MNFGDIVRGNWPAEFKPKSSTMFSWLMNNYWGTNFPAWQGGEFTFRYVIASNPTFDPASLTRFGLNALTPLERDDVQGSQDASVLPNSRASLLEIPNPGVTLLTWKRAEDGDGTILRLQESAGKASEVVVRSKYLNFEKVWHCDLLEEKQSEIKTSGDGFNFSIKPFQVITVRLHTAPNPNRGDNR